MPVDLWRAGVALMLFAITMGVGSIVEPKDFETAGIVYFLSLIGILLALLGSFTPGRRIGVEGV